MLSMRKRWTILLGNNQLHLPLSNREVVGGLSLNTTSRIGCSFYQYLPMAESHARPWAIMYLIWPINIFCSMPWAPYHFWQEMYQFTNFYYNAIFVIMHPPLPVHGLNKSPAPWNWATHYPYFVLCYAIRQVFVMGRY